MSKAGFGLIGCGTWGSVHARTYQASPWARLAEVCDQDATRAKDCAERYGAEKYCSDWRGLLSNPEIRAVSIATPDFAHSEIILAAIEAGKDVLSEKPLAATVEECQKILAARNRRGVKLMVDFHNRWNLPFLSIRRQLEAGELGKLLAINIRLNDTLFVPTRMLSWAARSSPVHFLGSHIIDLIRWMSDAEVSRVYAVSRSVVLKQAGIDTPDFFQYILELSSGATAVVENCWVVNESSPSVFDFQSEFIATKGSAYVNASHNRTVEVYTDRGIQLPDVAGAPDLYGKPVGFAVAAIEHFIDCVVNGKQPMVTGEDGLSVARVLAAIEESAITRHPVDIR
jgi:predicted dehydrogenase